jgi:hypothetical protein
MVKNFASIVNLKNGIIQYLSILKSIIQALAFND